MNLALKVGLEATYGTEQTVDTSTDAILLTKEPDIAFEWVNLPRDQVNPFYGASEEVPATGIVKMKFTTEIVASGTAGVAPAIGKLLIGCGMQETIFAGSRVEYTPISQNQSGLTFRFFNDGVRYVSKGGRGRVKLNLTATTIPTADFEFWSFARTETVAATASVDFKGLFFYQAHQEKGLHTALWQMKGAWTIAKDQKGRMGRHVRRLAK